jgi:hypothetical protein
MLGFLFLHAAVGSASDDVTPSVTTTTLSNDCILSEVVVDPDNLFTEIEPGCLTSLEFQTLGPGGTFWVFASDNVGGGNGLDLVTVADADRVTIDYWAGAIVPSPLTITVELVPEDICGNDSNSALGVKDYYLPEPSFDCVIRFSIPSAIDLGAVYVTVDYAESATNVVGCGYAPACQSRYTDFRTLYEKRDYDDLGLLDLNVRNAPGFSTPATIAECDLRFSGGSTIPDPDNFIVTVREARTPPPLYKEITPPPVVTAQVSCGSDVTTTTTTLPPHPAGCGCPCSPVAVGPTASDALYALNAAIGIVTCKTCICDVNRSGIVDSTDALTVLTKAVGLEATLRCVECSTPVSSVCGD